MTDSDTHGDSGSPRESGLLDVGRGHRIWWEEWGAPDGVPAVYLHGGPGGTLGRSAYRHRFDLTRTRLVGLEQRGCGRSLPHLGNPDVPLSGHTTADLVADLERLREHRGIDAWLMNGVSWGSTLALAYAQAHPDRVRGMVLVAVTTTSRREVDWITEGVGAIYPEAWERFAGYAERTAGYRSGDERLVTAYARLVESPDARVREQATQEWALWEDTHISIGAGGFTRDPRWADPAFRLAFFRLTAYLWSHDAFCAPPLLERTERLHGIPAVLVHGRRDVSSPAVTAWELHRRWPGSELVVDEGDGHGGGSMTQAWYAANARLVERLADR